jgi:hypothetical protein
MNRTKGSTRRIPGFARQSLLTWMLGVALCAALASELRWWPRLLIVAASMTTLATLATVLTLRQNGVPAGPLVGAAAGSISGLVALWLIESSVAAQLGDDYRPGPWLVRWSFEAALVGGFWGSLLGTLIRAGGRFERPPLGLAPSPPLAGVSATTPFDPETP